LVDGYKIFGGIASGWKCKIVPKDCYYQTTRRHIAEDHNITFTTLTTADLHTWCQHFSERLPLQKNESTTAIFHSAAAVCGLNHSFFFLNKEAGVLEEY
jgi:hypothetical protein